MPAHGHRFTTKEHRQVEHIKESGEKRGMDADEAERMGYATVNKSVEGDAKRRYTAKERRQAAHIIQSEEARGVEPAEAKSIAYATVNKLSHH